VKEVVSVSQRHLFRLIFSYRPTLQSMPKYLV